jgi:hypothetical protein
MHYRRIAETLFSRRRINAALDERSSLAPLSDGSFIKKTNDHVFPRGRGIQRPRRQIFSDRPVPSCVECNGKFGTLKKKTLDRAAICVGPAKADAAGPTFSIRRTVRLLLTNRDGGP